VTQLNPTKACVVLYCLSRNNRTKSVGCVLCICEEMKGRKIPEKKDRMKNGRFE
jgi:hypothetical protein